VRAPYRHTPADSAPLTADIGRSTQSSRTGKTPLGAEKPARPSTPNTRRPSRKQGDNDSVLQKLASETEGQLRHPQLLRLCRRPAQLRRLLKRFPPERVGRALLQADLQYRAPNGIRNPFGLICALCRDLDDTLLREHEARERRLRAQAERARRLRELQDQGCRKCGWWDVGFDGYCFECREVNHATAL